MELQASREGFGEALVKLGETNPKVVVLTADLTESTRCSEFKKRFPDRFFQFGVAEQNMMGVAAGLSLVGYIPFVCSYGVFTAGKCWEQLRMSVCYSGCNVKIEGAHAGLLVGPDGASHQAIEDIALTRVLPGLSVVVPCDSIEARKATLASASIEGSVYIRLGREPIPIITTEELPFVIGEGIVMREGKDVVIISCGVEVWKSLQAAEELSKEGIEAVVLNIHTIKPLDEKLILSVVSLTKCVVVAEEHQKIGGLGEAICSLLSRKYPVPVELVGIDDCFGTSGQPLELLEHYSLGSSSIVLAAKKTIERKKNGGVG